jgi:vancomycin permeability regulator SanA
LFRNKFLLIAFVIGLGAACALAAAGLLSRPAPATAAIVFGNTVDRDGRPSKRLEARLEAARVLHGRRIVRWILVSGGRGKEGHDEAAFMAQWLTAHGVPDTSILADHEGVTTEATCANARRMLGAAATVDVVTQWFHIPRAELAAARAGLDVRGASWPPYAEPRDAYSFARELVAYPAYFLRP